MNEEIKLPVIVAYGGGVNSTAMLVEMHKRGIVPRLILFADTGGERPETIQGVQQVSNWCVAHGFPPVITVKAPNKSLEQDCLDRNTLPSIAFGFKSCSLRWKVEPQQKYIRKWCKENSVSKYIQAVGYDAGEERRMRDSDDERKVMWYPLIEWGIWRDDCEEICRQHNLPTAKSSCFFCPSMRKHEVLALPPDLLKRALDMEKNANLTTISGLGRNWNWGDLINNENRQCKLNFSDAGTPEIDCGCYDG